MKKTILIFLSICLFSGCLPEGNDGCPDYLRLTFSYNSNKQEFNSRIGNDVYLCLYKNKKLFRTEMIPYASISDGKEYVMKKTGFDEPIDLVAWAVPVGGDASLLPVCPIGDDFDLRCLDMTLDTRASVAYMPMGSICLGTQTLNDDIEATSYLDISMVDCTSRVTVRVHNYGNGQSATPTVDLEGCKSSMSLLFQPFGDDVVTHLATNWVSSDQTYVSEQAGLLPSASDQVLKVTLYQGSTRVMSVDTNEKSVSGAVIEIDIYVGTKAVITVNGWRVRSVPVNML